MGLLDAQQIIIFRNRDEGMQMELEIRVTMPHYLVVHVDGRKMGGDYRRTYNVEKIGFFNGICYPLKGSLRESGSGMSKQNYDFEVSSVQWFDKGLLDHWFPEWPSATIVGDIAQDKTITIPPSERQLKKVAAIQPTYEINPQSPLWFIFRITMVIIGSAFILYALYRVWRRKLL